MSNSATDTTIEVDKWQVTRGATCSGCHAKIAWTVVLKSRARMPFDEPLAVLGETDDALVLDRTKSHFGTCPERKRFKRRRRGEGGYDGQRQ